VIWSLLCITNILGACLGKSERDTFTAAVSNECQGSINDSWLCIVGNLGGDLLQTCIMDVLASFRGKNKSGLCPPNPENERQRSINNFWSCILCNHSVTLWQQFIYKVVAAFSGKAVHGINVTPSSKSMSMECQQVLVLHIG